jgi:hypothetical protein
MLDVIGAGFGRTGTLSLKNALERLGHGRCHHMQEVFAAPESTAHWERAARGENIDWEAIYGDFRSTMDWPGARFWRELLANYPSARVILSTRDPERWYASAHQSIYQANLVSRASELGYDPLARRRCELVNSIVWDGTFHGRFDDKEYALQVFDEHYAAVRRDVPADRLLEYEVGQGWQPLCDFLGVPVPDEPFPQLNDRTSFSALLTGEQQTDPYEGF